MSLPAQALSLPAQLMSEAMLNPVAFADPHPSASRSPRIISVGCPFSI
jgi:hypothetical protein